MAVKYDKILGMLREDDAGGGTPLPDPLVPLSSTTAYVNKGGDDATGTFGDASKPYLTVQAAVNDCPNLGRIIICDGTYVENITFTQFDLRLTFSNATLEGNITSTQFFGHIALMGDTHYRYPNNARTNRIVGNVECARVTMTDMQWAGGRRVGTLVYDSSYTRCSIFYTTPGAGGANSFIENNNTAANQGVPTLFEDCDIVMQDAQLVDFSGTGSNRNVPYEFKNCRIQQFSNTVLTSTTFGGIQKGVSIKFTGTNQILVIGGPSTPTVFEGTSDGSATNPLTIDLSGVTIRNENGSLMEMTGTTQMELKAYSSLIVCQTAENINWVGNPANVVNLQSTSNSKRPWNTLGVVNPVVSNDFIDPNIT